MPNIEIQPPQSRWWWPLWWRLSYMLWTTWRRIKPPLQWVFRPLLAPMEKRKRARLREEYYRETEAKIRGAHETIPAKATEPNIDEVTAIQAVADGSWEEVYPLRWQRWQYSPGQSSVPNGNELNPILLPVGDAATAELPVNEQGRDFVVGDVHGRFDHLRFLMRAVQFDPRVDRMISVGDLVDRGPTEAEAPDWWAQPWFLATRGNHEQMIVDHHGQGEVGTPTDEQLQDKHEYFRDEGIRLRMARGMPLALTVHTRQGRVGVVHANVPEDRTWDGFIKALRAGSRMDVASALFSYRHGAARPVLGIEAVCVGHYPTPWRFTTGNVYQMDTGGPLIQQLTLAEITATPWRFWACYTGDQERSHAYSGQESATLILERDWAYELESPMRWERWGGEDHRVLRDEPDPLSPEERAEYNRLARAEWNDPEWGCMVDPEKRAPIEAWCRTAIKQKFDPMVTNPDWEPPVPTSKQPS